MPAREAIHSIADRGPSSEALIHHRNVSVGGLLFAGTYVASPYYAAQVIKSAARDGDFIALNEHVDYPAVRESLKDQFAAQIAEESRRSGEGNSASALVGTALAGMFIDRIIDTFIRPESVAALLRNGSLSAPNVESRSSLKSKRKRASGTPTATPDSSEIDPHDASSDVVLGYHGLSRFEIAVQPRSHDAGPARFVLARHGVFHWDLVAVVVPMQDLANR